jgi:hypothetical protein
MTDTPSFSDALSGLGFAPAWRQGEPESIHAEVDLGQIKQIRIEAEHGKTPVLHVTAAIKEP